VKKKEKAVVKLDMRESAPVQISLSWQQFYWWKANVAFSRWWGHLTRIFWHQPLRYYERGLHQGLQPSWSK